MACLIRPQQRDDCKNLAALSIQVWLSAYANDGLRDEISDYVLTHFTEEAFVDCLQHEHKTLSVAVLDEHVVGYVIVDVNSQFKNQHRSHYRSQESNDTNLSNNNDFKNENGFEIETLYVQPQQQGEGIGQSLLNHVNNSYGVPFWLSTWVHNTPAIAFYERFGFVDIGKKFFELGGEQHENRVLRYTGDK